MAEGFDLYVWSNPRGLDAATAGAMIDRWLAEGGDPAKSPFEATSDIAWFYRELRHDSPQLELVSDAGENPNTRPVWLQSDEPAQARLVAMRLENATAEDAQEILSLAVKYDLVIYNPRQGTVREPQAEMSAYASRTFWPGGAIRTILAAGIALLVIAGAWLIGIPILSGLVIVFAAVMFAIFVWTLIAEVRRASRRGK